MTLNRVFLICLALLGVSWLALFAVDLVERADDREYYETTVAPQIKSGAAFTKGGAMQQSLARTQARLDNAYLRFLLCLGSGGLVMVWAVATVVRNETFWKRRNAAVRAADANAGVIIAELRKIGGRLTARAAGGSRRWMQPPGSEVEVDAATETIVFRGFNFTRSFVGNRPTAAQTLRFDDVLGGQVWMHHGRQFFYLRTTLGKVQITDAVRPFEALIVLLLDVAEWNRSDPERYARALAREPQIKIPWYGWAILGTSVAGLVVLGVFLANLPAK